MIPFPFLMDLIRSLFCPSPKQAGLQGLSPDHDTIDAYWPEFFEEAARLSVHLLPGIELSTEWESTSCPVSRIWDIDIASASLKNFLQEMQRRRNERNRGILEKFGEEKLLSRKKKLQQFAINALSAGLTSRAHG